MSQDNLPEELLAQPSKPWLTWIMTSLLVTGVLTWWLGPVIMRKAKSFIILYHTEKASEWIKQGDWVAAHLALDKARSWHPDNPRYLRVMADFLVATQSEPATTLHYLRLLENMGQTSEEDLLKMGQIYIQQQNAHEADRTLGKLKTETREKRPALELLANIQRLRGEPRLAEETLRRALKQDKDDSMCRLRLALLDQGAAFSEMREQARQSLWSLTTGKDRAALLSIEHLAQDLKLTATEADQLQERLETHPDKTDQIRFTVLSGLVTTQPAKKKDIFKAELERMKSLTEEQLLPSLGWLLKEKQPQHVVEFRPRDFFTKSPTLIQPYLQALGDLGRWEEVDRLLSRPAGMPVSSAFISFWRAKATHKLDDEPTRVRQHLATVYEATGRGRDAPIAAAAAALAEETGLWDTASKFYAGLAEHQPAQNLIMLEKVHEMSLRSRDSEAALASSSRLLSLRPENRRYLFDELYLHLVCGKDIESHFAQISAISHTLTSDEERLCLALAAYRLGDLTELRQHLNAVQDPRALKPGQRAVHAGLLSISGQVGHAFQTAEQVPTSLLLKEEARFLQRAL